MTVKVVCYHPVRRSAIVGFETWDSVVANVPLLPPGFTLSVRPGAQHIGAIVVIDYRVRAIAARRPSPALTFPNRPLIPVSAAMFAG